MAEVCLVVNPRSGAGRTGRHLDELVALARASVGEVEVRLTERVGDGIPQARDAILGGARRVVAVGGDGTINEVVNGVMAADVPGVVLGIVPGGTGSDLARTLKLPSAWSAAVPIAVSAPGRPTDVLEGRFTGQDGAELLRHGINVTGMGMAGDVVRRVNAGSKALGGTLTFLKATLASLAAWRAPEVELTWEEADGRAGQWTGLLANAFVGNGQYCGGGIWIGPRGRMDDGLFELVIIPQLPMSVLVTSVPHLYTGRIAEVRGVQWAQVRTLRARTLAPAEVLADADGEQPGRLPLSIRVLERRILLASP